MKKIRLKEVRKLLGLTQKAMAEPLGLNQTNIRDLESGKVKFSTLHALALEQVYKINSNWLLTGAGEIFIDENLPPIYKGINPDPEKEHQIELSVIEDKHRDLIQKFKDKTTAKEINKKLIDLERMSERSYRKVVNHINEVWETVADVLDDLREKNSMK